MRVSFVIPIYDSFSLVNQLMVDIMNHTVANEIIIVDDYSQNPATLNGLQWWATNLDGVKIIRPVQNLGFLRASNYGMSKATGDILCLISSDVRIEDDLAKILRNLLTENPKRLIGGTVYWNTTGWNEFGSRVYPYAEGWLLACTKEAWEDFGGFDVRYVPNDFEDVDISTTARSKGYELVALNNPKIQHLGGRTIGYTEGRMELTQRNKEKFREKWILEPASGAR